MQSIPSCIYYLCFLLLQPQFSYLKQSEEYLTSSHFKLIPHIYFSFKVAHIFHRCTHCKVNVRKSFVSLFFKVLPEPIPLVSQSNKHCKQNNNKSVQLNMKTKSHCNEMKRKLTVQKIMQTIVE